MRYFVVSIIALIVTACATQRPVSNLDLDQIPVHFGVMEQFRVKAAETGTSIPFSGLVIDLILVEFSDPYPGWIEIYNFIDNDPSRIMSLPDVRFNEEIALHKMQELCSRTTITGTENTLEDSPFSGVHYYVADVCDAVCILAKSRVKQLFATVLFAMQCREKSVNIVEFKTETLNALASFSRRDLP